MTNDDVVSCAEEREGIDRVCTWTKHPRSRDRDHDDESMLTTVEMNCCQPMTGPLLSKNLYENTGRVCMH